MSCASLNSGDVFVLDAGLKLIQWQGSKCSGPERQKAAALMQAIDDERMGKPVKVQISETDKDSDPDVAEFWKALGGKGVIKQADDLDDKWEEGFPTQLYRLSDAKGKLTMTLEGTGIIPKVTLFARVVFSFLTLFFWTEQAGHQGRVYHRRRVGGVCVDRKEVLRREKSLLVC